MGIPKLEARDIRTQLEDVFASGKPQPHHLLAIYGRGDAGLVEAGSAGAFKVIPVASELELRRALPRRHDSEDRTVFLVGWPDAELPSDIAGRFAKRGRIVRIGPDVRLRQLFGGAEVTNEVIASPLGRYLAAQDDRPVLSVGGGRVSPHVAWSAWLSHAFHVDVSGGLGLDSLLVWAARNGRGASFTAAMQRPEAVGVRAALLEHLGRPDVLGPAGPLVWRAWETERGSQLLQLAILLEALWQEGKPADATVEVWLGTVCEQSLGFDPTRDPVAVEALRLAVPGALRLLRHATPERVPQLLRDAEAWVTHDKIRAWLERSKLLPIAWQLRLQRLGRHLREAAARPAAEHVEQAVKLLDALASHDQFMDDAHTRDYERAAMACRLLSFLATRSDQRLTITAAPESAAEAYGRWYAEDGGYIDWARRWARGATPDTDFGRGIAAVLARVDQIRTELDRAFARALPAWLEVKRSARHLLPIEQAAARTVIPFLEGRGGPQGRAEPRRLLVLLMDGMAWSQAVELLASLGESSRPWSPIAFNQQVMERATMHLPVVAMMPSITEVSRVAFFDGKAPASGKPHRTTEDSRRWRERKDIGRFFAGADAPQLLLKGDGFGRDGSAAPEALTLVRDASQPVVAIVINAIDDHLKSGTQEDRDWTVARIAALRDLLEAARDAGRAVLLASDHGHVPGDRLTEHAGRVKDGGARWRPWLGPNDPVAEHELAIPGEHAWTPKGAQGVVCLVDDTRSYNAQQHAGEHGGASLAELLAPAVFIGWDGMNEGLAAHRDPALQLCPEDKPPWWIFDVVVPDAAEEPSPTGRKPRKPKPAVVPEGQLHLLAAPIPPPPSQVPASIRDKVDQLRKRSVFQQLTSTEERREEVLKAVQVLLERKGVASQDAFATAMSKPPFRVPGLVSTLSEVLNVDGTPVLRYDPTAKQVHLNEAQLWQCFDE